ncbi:unnamed protein product, partial [marine sediment metagenome]
TFQKNLSAGVYFYQLTTLDKNRSEIRKMVLIDGGNTVFKISILKKVKSEHSHVLLKKAMNSELHLTFSHPTFYPINKYVNVPNDTSIQYIISMRELPDENTYVDQDGGIISIESESDINGTEISIPPGAMNTGQILSVKENLSIPSVNDTLFDFYSPGLSIKTDGDSFFSKPIIISMPIYKDEIDEYTVAGPAYFNKDSSKWEFIHTAILDTVSEKITFSVNHLTDFIYMGITIPGIYWNPFLDNDAAPHVNALWAEIVGEKS